MTVNDESSRNVPPGGSATINGVLYQILWSLLQASRARFVKRPVVQGEQLEEVTIVLEPLGGGGDLVVHQHEERLVEQLKARPDGSTWSLREIIESVVPDLYLADPGDDVKTRFRFVTEGRMGEWQNVYKFFRSLKNRTCPDADPLEDLDDEKVLKFSGQKGKSPKANGEPPFWELDEYTERSLFQKVVTEVRKRKVVRDNEDEITTQRRLRKLLGNFHFVGGQDMAAVQREIDSHLIAIVDRNDDLPKIRDSLAMELARRATEGSAEISCDEFFRDQGLKAIPLNEWATLRAAARRTTESTLQNLGYDEESDVRTGESARTFSEWPKNAPVLAISGESGCGKSWRQYGICALAKCHEPLSVVVTAGASVDITLDRISAKIWQEIAGHDDNIPLPQIARRVHEVVGDAIAPWLMVGIDGSLAPDQAKELIRQPWEDWGVRIVITVGSRLAATLDRESQGRCHVLAVSNYTSAELHKYLELFLGEHWPAMPEFVRNPLRNPLLASIYRQIIESEGSPNWIPQSEYELFAAYWNRMQEQEPLDELVLSQLANRLLEEPRSLLSSREVAKAGANNEAILRLERAGWIRMTHTPTGTVFEFPHVRLLNWACAHAKLSQLRQGNVTVTSLVPELQSFLHGTSERHGRTLGFVPMDLLWLMCHDQDLRLQIPVLISGLEEGGYRQSEILYTELLPTLGSTVIDAMTVRLHETVDNVYQCSMIARAIGNVGGVEAVNVGMALLNDENPLLQRAATHIFTKCPSPDALAPLWHLHNACISEPDRFRRDSERPGAPSLYLETFSALRECCRSSPDWLNDAIASADPRDVEVSDLGYLLANIGGDVGRDLWNAHKATLFDKVPHDKRRCLATCIDTYADSESIPWLIENICVPQNLLGARAFSTLARLEPNTAVEQLHRLPRAELVMTRSWYSDSLFTVALGDMQGKLRRMMTEEPNVWSVARVYEGRQQHMDVETLDVLLRDLEQRLPEVLSAPDLEDRDPFYTPLKLLASVNTKALVDHLGTWRGSNLEENLCELVIRIGPRRGLDADSLVRDEAIEVLYRINGEGFTRAVNSLLRANSRFGRFDGLELASKKPNPETIELLTAIAEQDETWDGHYIEQCKAARILAEEEAWEPVIGLVRKIGLKASTSITELTRFGKRPPPELLNDIASFVAENPSDATDGDVLALGFGAHELSDIVRSVSQACDPPSEVAHACVIALQMLGDQDEQSVAFLTEQLGVQKHQFSATNSLIVNGSGAALLALSDYVGDHVEGAIAATLVNKLRDPDSAVERIRQNIVRSIQQRPGSVSPNEVYSMLARIDDEDIVRQVLGDPTIDEFLRSAAFADEGSSWVVGARASAIRCLAYVEPRSAFIAARSTLRNTSAHDRDFYPPLMAKINPEAAANELLHFLKTEESKSVRESICRTLAVLDLEVDLVSGLQSQDTDELRVFCEIAGWAKESDRIREQLTHCVSSLDERVARAAGKALAQLALKTETQRLGQAVLSADNEEQRWLYLDCLVSLAEPGDRHRPWPVTGPEIGRVLTQLQVEQSMTRLEKRRKKENG